MSPNRMGPCLQSPGRGKVCGTVSPTPCGYDTLDTLQTCDPVVDVTAALEDYFGGHLLTRTSLRERNCVALWS